jgi:hypothetical protein
LHERFNENALYFLKKTLENMIASQLEVKPIVNNLKEIDRILIKDSVCFDIDSSMAEHYPGSSGSASDASIRIQFEYDALTGKINDLSVGAFNAQDSKNSFDTIELTQAGDLIIRDLAYMSLKVIKKIITAIKGLFISRLNTNTNIYENKNGCILKVDFVTLLNDMNKQKLSMVEKMIFLGEKDRLQVRLIVHRLPDHVVAERIRRANSNNKKKKRGGLSKEAKARMAFNLFITNATAEQIPGDRVWPLYRLRWQIELIFKIWKSICNIEKVKKVNKHRLECYIYSKLIFIILCWQIIWKIANVLFLIDKKAISYFKAFKTILRHEVENIRNILIWKTSSLRTFMLDFYKLSFKKHLLEKRKNSITSLDILLAF